jgi:hypothetical protein
MKKIIILPAVAFTTAVLSAMVMTTSVSAFWPFDGISKTTTETSPSITPTLIDKLIEKFGLNKNEVQTVINTFRTEKQADMQARFEARLTTAVKNGELTEAQKQLILTKHAELIKNQEADFQNRQTKRTELEAWATQNGIDLKYFNQGKNGRGMGEGMGMRRGMGKVAN